MRETEHNENDLTTSKEVSQRCISAPRGKLGRSRKRAIVLRRARRIEKPINRVAIVSLSQADYFLQPSCFRISVRCKL